MFPLDAAGDEPKTSDLKFSMIETTWWASYNACSIGKTQRQG